jgi:hypothetical protein
MIGSGARRRVPVVVGRRQGTLRPARCGRQRPQRPQPPGQRREQRRLIALGRACFPGRPALQPRPRTYPTIPHPLDLRILPDGRLRVEADPLVGQASAAVNSGFTVRRVSEKRGRNKKLYQRSRRVNRRKEMAARQTQLVRSCAQVRWPSEFDQMSVQIDERALGLPETTLSQL